MRKIEELQIHFVDRDHFTCEVLKDFFRDCENVIIHHTDIKRFFYEHSEIDCLVSPANAFGKMTGGYDAALSDILGWDFQKKVQQYIKDHFYGEQGVATSFFIETDIPGVSLIHTPTMQYPSVIKDSIGSFIALGVGYIVLAGMMGIKWELLYRMTGSLYAGMADHFFNNCIATNLVHVTT